ncbi:hypothetical protein CY35_17G088800 [Sphagnum magellanicum]|nr:hypothetical protein CY35_17G088800 [Sphagnum magellanicum]KAH9536096.1 hypothetical protein CY35_17G088800 [Sphagnum magellanicum]
MRVLSRAKRMQRTGQVKSSVGSNSCTLLTATSFGWQSTIAARSNSLLLVWAKTGFQLACGHPVVKCTIANKHRLHMGQTLEFSATC